MVEEKQETKQLEKERKKNRENLKRIIDIINSSS